MWVGYYQPTVFSSIEIADNVSRQYRCIPCRTGEVYLVKIIKYETTFLIQKPPQSHFSIRNTYKRICRKGSTEIIASWSIHYSYLYRVTGF